MSEGRKSGDGLFAFKAITRTACMASCATVVLLINAVTHAEPLRIMTIGDSRVHGLNTAFNSGAGRLFPMQDYNVNGIGPDSQPFMGGFRVPLWEGLTNFGLDVEMVGSQSKTPDTFGGTTTLWNDGYNAQNSSHEGHSSWRIGGSYTDGSVTNGAFPYHPTSIPNNWGSNSSTADNKSAPTRGVYEHIAQMFNHNHDTNAPITSNKPGTDPSNVNAVVLWIGINDIKNNEGVATAPQRLINVVDRINQFAPHTQIFVLNLGHASTDGQYVTQSQNLSYSLGNVATVNTAVDTFNSSFASLLDQQSYANVSLVDINAAINEYRLLIGDDKLVFGDGLHYTDATFAYIGNYLAGHIADFYVGVIPEPTTLAIAGVGVLLLMGQPRRRAA